MTHPPREVLRSYAMGLADLPRRLLVEAHLALCTECSMLVPQYRGQETRLPEPTIADEGVTPPFERVWRAVERVDEAAVCPEAGAVLPQPFRAWLPVPAALRWITLWPQRVRSAVLARDDETGSALYLSYHPPQSVYPRHRHVGLEENVILSGGYQNGDAHVEAGDWVIGAPGTEHTPTTGPDEACWCLSRVEWPGIRFRGWRELARRLLFSRRGVDPDKPWRRIIGSDAGLASLPGSDVLQGAAPVSFRMRIGEPVRTNGAPSPDVRSSSRHLTVLPAALLAATLVGLLVLSTVLTHHTREKLPSTVAQLVAEHQRYGEEGQRELDIRTSDPVRLAAWFTPRLGFPLELPLVPGPDQRLIGGRVSSVAGSPAAHLVYEWRGHHISLIAARTMPHDVLSVPGQRVDGVELRSSVAQGVALVWWGEEDEGRVYAAVSGSSPQTVVEFARRCVKSPSTSTREKHPT
jgi:putative transcriptional regulator